MIDHRLDRIHLDAGGHRSPEDGMCVMEAASMLAGEEFSDRPKCVSAVIGGFLRTWNDALTDHDRQMLRPYAIRVIGTATDQAISCYDAIEIKRAYLALDWLIRTYLAAWYLSAELVAHAKTIESLPPVVDQGSLIESIQMIVTMTEGTPFVREGVLAAMKESAGEAAWEAAYVTGVGETQLMAEIRTEVEMVVMMAVIQKVKMQPTVALLQRSAFNLLDRMLALKPGIWTPETEKNLVEAEKHLVGAGI